MRTHTGAGFQMPFVSEEFKRKLCFSMCIHFLSVVYFGQHPICYWIASYGFLTLWSFCSLPLAWRCTHTYTHTHTHTHTH